MPGAPDGSIQRLHLRVEGVVQGVGFRPFVYHLAHAVGVTGWIYNTPQGVVIEVEGRPAQLQAFHMRLPQDKPALAQVQRVEATWIEAIGDTEFVIHPSESVAAQPPSTLILPDLATCPACLREIFDPASRHYHYPFTNCTHCGPRFSIVRSLPYDRAHTTLSQFPLCAACQAEYDHPCDRRFHAQPNACPHCGPHLELWDALGQVQATHEAALQQAATAVRAGQILALKGLGGFHLMVDARNAAAVQQLRDRKHRPAKPLAVMVASLEQARVYAQVSPLAAQLLASVAAPIVLLPQRVPDTEPPLAAAIAPDTTYLGLMLPYTPLHHLLLAELDGPVVATSGNRAGEPICTDETQALATLAGIADLFLVHNRPIARPVDDSIVQEVDGRTCLLRRARGYAPFPIALPIEPTASKPEVILAVGGHLKNTVALYVQPQVWLSPHVGDLDQVPTRDQFEAAIAHLCRLYHTQPTVVACDAHPDYASTQFARALTTSSAATPTATTSVPQLITVQHHYAHVLSGLADNQWQPPVLGIAWDGTGYGLDGTIWGGEFLWIPAAAVPEVGFVRLAHLRPFPLPGGEQAVQEPRRCALGLLAECLGDRLVEADAVLGRMFLPQELGVLQTMLQRRLNTPRTSSVGRLFDAIAALLGFCPQVSFEGQAALQLEGAIADHALEATYPYRVTHTTQPPWQLDYGPMVAAILRDLQAQVPPGIIAALFHNTLVAALVDIACRLRQQHPAMQRIILTGGCFQNRYLLQRAVAQLQAHDFLVGSQQQLPTNDGGLAAGQVMAALRHLQQSSAQIQTLARSES